MKKGDFFLIGIILISSLIFLLFINKREDIQGNKYASIQIGGEEVAQLEMYGDNVNRTFRYDMPEGYNIVEIGEGKVRVKEDNSRDQIAVMQGWKSKTGEILVCLPHKFVIEIKSDEIISDVDHINY